MTSVLWAFDRGEDYPLPMGSDLSPMEWSELFHNVGQGPKESVELLQSWNVSIRAALWASRVAAKAMRGFSVLSFSGDKLYFEELRQLRLEWETTDQGRQFDQLQASLETSVRHHVEPRMRAWARDAKPKRLVCAFERVFRKTSFSGVSGFEGRRSKDVFFCIRLVRGDATRAMRRTFARRVVDEVCYDEMNRRLQANDFQRSVFVLYDPRKSRTEQVAAFEFLKERLLDAVNGFRGAKVVSEDLLSEYLGVKEQPAQLNMAFITQVLEGRAASPQGFWRDVSNELKKAEWRRRAPTPAEECVHGDRSGASEEGERSFPEQSSLLELGRRLDTPALRKMLPKAGVAIIRARLENPNFSDDQIALQVGSSRRTVERTREVARAKKRRIEELLDLN